MATIKNIIKESSKTIKFGELSDGDLFTNLNGDLYIKTNLLNNVNSVIIKSGLLQSLDIHKRVYPVSEVVINYKT